MGKTHNVVVFDPIGLGPCAHDEGIIVCQHGHDIDLFPFDLFQILNVSWQVTNGASWGKGSWDREEDDFLVGPFFRCVVVDGDAACRDGFGLRCVRDVPVWLGSVNHLSLSVCLSFHLVRELTRRPRRWGIDHLP